MTERAKIKLSKTESTKVDRNSSEDNKKVKITEETQPVTPKYTFPVVSQSNSGNIIKRLRPDDILTVKQGKQNNIILYSDLTGSPDLYYEFVVDRRPFFTVNFATGNKGIDDWRMSTDDTQITNPGATSGVTTDPQDAVRTAVEVNMQREYERGFRRFNIRTPMGARTTTDTGRALPSASWSAGDPNLGTWNDAQNISTVKSGGATLEYVFTTTGKRKSVDATAATADRQQSFINFLKPWIDSKTAAGDPVEVYIYDGYQLAFHDTTQTDPARGNLAMVGSWESEWSGNTSARFPMPDFSKSSHVEFREYEVIPWRDEVGINGFMVDAASNAGDTAGTYSTARAPGYFDFYRSRGLDIIGEAVPLILDNGVYGLNPDLYKLTPYVGYGGGTADGDAGNFWGNRNWRTILPSETDSEIHMVVQWAFQGGTGGINTGYWNGATYDFAGITAEIKQAHDNGFVVDAGFGPYLSESPAEEVKRSIVLDYIVELGGSTLDPVNYAVTVVSTDDGNKYFIDGVRQNTMYFRKGRTYKLNLGDSVSSHPFWIQTTDNGGEWDDGNEITSGISRNGANSGTITYTVPSDAPSTLYYRCQFHGGMGGQINIVSV